MLFKEIQKEKVTGRRGRRRKHLLNDLKAKRRCHKLKEDALVHPVWTTRFGRVYGPIVTPTAEGMSVIYETPDSAL
jgi:hypothetical protein